MGLQVADQLTRPVVVGATGGSGTRAAGTLLQQGTGQPIACARNQTACTEWTPILGGRPGL
jgi:uncharacterized protein YbjT (DUF2867 family)